MVSIRKSRKAIFNAGYRENGQRNLITKGLEKANEVLTYQVQI